MKAKMSKLTGQEITGIYINELKTKVVLVTSHNEQWELSDLNNPDNVIGRITGLALALGKKFVCLHDSGDGEMKIEFEPSNGEVCLLCVLFVSGKLNYVRRMAIKRVHTLYSLSVETLGVRKLLQLANEEKIIALIKDFSNED